MFAQLGMFDARQELASPPASITARRYCKSCRRKPATQCAKCRTWRSDYDSVSACLLSAWPAQCKGADVVTLRLRGPLGDVVETGTERRVREVRSLLCMAGVGQEV